MSTHRLQHWTTGVSNPVRYPSFRFSVSVYTQIIAFALGLPSIINIFYPSNRNSIILYLYSSFSVLKKFIKLSFNLFFST
jgi:hypothetical protein